MEWSRVTEMEEAVVADETMDSAATREDKENAWVGNEHGVVVGGSFRPDMDTHLKHSEITLSTLKKHTLFAKINKWSFGQDKVEYLGHIIFKEGVATDPVKIDCMLKWPTPVTLKELWGFVGLTGYYKKFMKNYEVICKPLTDLLKKDNFHWNTNAQVSLDTLKKAVTSTPVLVLPDFSTYPLRLRLMHVTQG
ncbi:uncharacterized protein LOC113358908 [Papaver somniferum]|uniref:uncharacterized protein LOC113358908 n=1 Tax=Papaver somniferum TaxID=3469 RepID=UPI000E6F9E73|nr:uncharacterized protein LOC113358908 [Papaver somniferum]